MSANLARVFKHVYNTTGSWEEVVKVSGIYDRYVELVNRHNDVEDIFEKYDKRHEDAEDQFFRNLYTEGLKRVESTRHDVKVYLEKNFHYLQPLMIEQENPPALDYSNLKLPGYIPPKASTLNQLSSLKTEDLLRIVAKREDTPANIKELISLMHLRTKV